MNVVADLDRALAQLRAGLTPYEIAAEWSETAPIAVPEGSQLIVVRTPAPPWRMVQVVGTADGELEVIFDLPDGERAEISELVDVFGEPEVEDSFDGPQILWFRVPGQTGYLVGASMRRDAANAGFTRSLTVARTTS